MLPITASLRRLRGRRPPVEQTVSESAYDEYPSADVAGCPEPGRAVSMAQVARAAGVSQQTVSRVVNGRSNVSPRTRDRVERAMRELGFRPSFAGRLLRSGHYDAVGLCVYNVGQFGNLGTVKGILNAAREMGSAVTMVEMDDTRPFLLADATRRMAELPIDALIIAMTIRSPDFEAYRPNPTLGTVLLSMYEHPLCTTVDADQYACSRLVVDHLAALGHREIRFLGGPTYVVDSEFRERGWRDALTARGITPVEPLHGDWTAESGYALGTHLARDERATAVYAANDQMAMGLIQALRDAGRRVPEDVSVVGVDDSLRYSVPRLELTTVRFDLFRRGKLAVAEALAAARGGMPHAVRIAPELVLRSSTAEARR